MWPLTQPHSSEEDEGGAKMWVLVSQKICTPKTFTGFGSISISRCQDFVTFFTEKTGPPYLSKYAESVISYPPKHTNVQPWNSSKHWETKKIWGKIQTWHPAKPNGTETGIQIVVLGVQIFWLTKTHILVHHPSSSVLY